MGPYPIYRVPIPGGDTGTAKTVSLIRALIDQGAKDPAIRELAASIALSGDTDLEKVLSLHDFVKSRMMYLRDPVNAEYLGGARYHLDSFYRRGFASGDCDDHTIFLGSLLESVGYPVRLVTTRQKPGFGPYDHIYLETYVGGRWVPLDAAKKRFLYRKPSRLRRWEGNAMGLGQSSEWEYTGTESWVEPSATTDTSAGSLWDSITSAVSNVVSAFTTPQAVSAFANKYIFGVPTTGIPVSPTAPAPRYAVPTVKPSFPWPLVLLGIGAVVLLSGRRR